MARLCIFCGQPATDHEDVIPVWAMEIIGLFSPTALNYMQIQFGNSVPLEPWPIRKDNARTDANIRPKRVCFSCNSVWMSRLEGRCIPLMSPLMNDLSIPLSREDQKQIATWSLKTAMAFECVRGGPWFYSQAEREHLRATLAPTGDTKVWLGRHSRRGDILAFAEGKKLGSRTAETIHGELIGKGYVTTFVLAHLVIQILTIRRPPSPHGTTLHSLPGAWDDRGLIEIWPPVGPTHWPPSLTFREEPELEALSGRFALGQRRFSRGNLLERFGPT